MTTHQDHIEIGLLVTRFFRAMDERAFPSGWARDCLTDDARMVAPVGIFEGAEAVRGTEEALKRFARTQHMASDLLTDVDAGSDTARASWNALMVHIHHEGDDPLFTVGGRYEAEPRRTKEGRRFSRMAVEAVWTTGRPPVLTPA
ncbi:nuclear transport factor 2 family protein [Streptomyces sp. NPDC086835]|uniref:nuclear transport factor 2 family protein n=1 Tax=Streptomyces sp. NPDC086835 TaxID=3365761 RepID=UPI0037F295C1